MANSAEQICNMALAHIGHTIFIDSLETEQSTEAEVCNLFYEPARDFVLEDFPWPEATKYAALGLVEEEPNDDWLFSYRYPDDCHFVRRISTPLGRTTPEPSQFKIGADDTGKLIYCNDDDAVIEYTKHLTDVAQFRPTFTLALSWYMAALICPGLSKNPKQADRCMQMYAITKSTAQARALNEQQEAPEPESEFIRARA